MNDRILVVDDEKNIRWLLKRLFTQKGLSVDEAASGGEAIALLGKNAYQLVFLDIIMPDMLGLDVLDGIVKDKVHPPVIIMTAQSTMKNAVEAMRRGAFDYLTKPFELSAVETLASRAIESFRMLRTTETASKSRASARPEDEDEGIIGTSQVMNEIYKMIGKIADSDVTVLIQGERGSGKDLIARTIHKSSCRSTKPFVSINCAAIPKDLLESELFGYEKGSFTGANERKVGKFELAHDGTLFLDEIGDMSLDLQAKMLRAIEEKEVAPLGASRSVKVNVRIIAATNQPLLEMIKDRRFRADLYDRLNQVPILVPPLRERPDDIEALVKFFINRYSKEMRAKKTVSPDAMAFLKLYDWPGNVRELQNALRRACLISSGTVLEKNDFIFLASTVNREEMIKNLSLEEIMDWKLEDVFKLLFSGAGDPEDVHEFIISQIERPLIRKVLAVTGGNQIRAAKILGLNRNTLRKKVKQYGVVCKEFKKKTRSARQRSTGRTGPQ